MRTLFSTLLLAAYVSCTAQHPGPVIRLDADHVVFLLDSAAASEALLHDPIDRFFERVTPAEMSIQMKQPLDEQVPDSILRERYKAFLQTDVADFTANEAAFVMARLLEIFPVCQSVSPSIFPDTLRLIKTKTQHYGPGVWYTRMNYIVIPEDALTARHTRSFTSTLYHEVFHIYSRMHPEAQKELYQIIGFEPIGYENLTLPPLLAGRVLHNPDGVNFAQKIRLTLPDSAVADAIPIIRANEAGFVSGKPTFFSYLDFQLYEIKQQEDGKWQVITGADGLSSTLDLRNIPDFFRQIRDNTNYIIHPDEIMADNFSFLMKAQKDPSSLDRFSPEGQELLQLLEKLLRQE